MKLLPTWCRLQRYKTCKCQLLLVPRLYVL